MAVEQRRRAPRQRREDIRRDPIRAPRLGQELLEQHRARADAPGLLARDHRGEFVLEREEAGRLEPDDGQAGGRVRRERVDQTPLFRAGLLDHALRQPGPAAA